MIIGVSICNDCGRIWNFECPSDLESTLECPRCHSMNSEILQGEEE